VTEPPQEYASPNSVLEITTEKDSDEEDITPNFKTPILQKSNTLSIKKIVGRQNSGLSVGVSSTNSLSQRMGIKLNLGKSGFDIIKENATQLRIEKKEQDKIRSFKDAYI
jgi:hypothetical protein